VATAIIGGKKFILWGNAAKIASRMESRGQSAPDHRQYLSLDRGWSICKRSSTGPN
jgi:hypothetical protein